LQRKFPEVLSRKLVPRIHGIDSDPNAVHVARLSIWLESGANKRDWRAIVVNIREGDSLVEFLTHDRNKYDMVVGNPPYRNVKRGIAKRTREFCKANYESASGQWDLAAPFVELTLNHLLVKNGACGLILPNPVLLAENYHSVRKIILRNDLVAYGPAGRAFDDPGVEANLLVARAGKPVRYRKPSAVVLDAKNGGLVRELRSVPWRLIRRLPSEIFSHLADPGFLEPILDGLGTGRLVRLGDIVRLTRGIECGKRDERVIRGTARRSKNSRPLIAGESVAKYHAEAAYQFSVPSGIDNRKILKAADIWSGKNQLLLRRVADGPIAAVMSPATLVLNTIYVVRARVEVRIDEYASCALFNASAFREIFRQMFAFDDKLFPYLRISQLNGTPVPYEALTDSRLAEWSMELHGIAVRQKKSPSGKGAALLLEKIDKRVMKLYGL